MAAHFTSAARSYRGATSNFHIKAGACFKIKDADGEFDAVGITGDDEFVVVETKTTFNNVLAVKMLSR